ncbi:MAG: DNA polymerase IV [Rhodospirillales bacterium]|nr:DNA polymerase IV [Rhodospirillales bacterium]MBO6786105.1 DNA polymerase IV [Rhodospirillales bacterium]
MSAICRDCADIFDTPPDPTCPNCGGTRFFSHPELLDLEIAHMDCDAFYASVEKRDNPDIRGKPVIVGGGRRGVVSACCYIARIYGIRSAMPMFKALKACPDAVVIRPNMEKYRDVGHQVRDLMQSVTPMVEPISIDEAFLDLSGTRRLHHGAPAATLVKLAKRIEDEIGINVSIGLSYNKFLAKLASDLDKPRGFAAIGREEAVTFLAEKPVGILWGVGRALRKKLEYDGIAKVGDLHKYDEAELVARYGAIGTRLKRFSEGKDVRSVDPESVTKSISAETTFEDDVADPDALKVTLWGLAEKVARRLGRAGYACDGVQLKLKSADFKLVTRSRKLPGPTKLADEIYNAAEALLMGEADGKKLYRLIGVGAERLLPADQADQPDLADPDRGKRVKVADAIDAVRAKFGDKAIGKGRGFKG